MRQNLNGFHFTLAVFVYFNKEGTELSYSMEYDNQTIVYKKLPKQGNKTCMLVSIYLTVGLLLGNYIAMNLWFATNRQANNSNPVLQINNENVSLV